MKKWAPIALFTLMIFASLFGLAALFKNYDLTNEISLPLLAIAGVMALLGSLAIVAIAFSLMNMSDRTQALGLPNGSVRAVIALSLVVLFAILTVYLFTALHNDGVVQKAYCVADPDKFERALGARQVIDAVENTLDIAGKPCAGVTETAAAAVAAAKSEAPVGPPPVAPTPSADAGAAPPASPAPATPASPPSPTPATAKSTAASQRRFEVLFRSQGNTASEDFAKQLLVLIGTLVTSVASFYFGSKATSDVRDSVATGDGPPTLLSVQPTTLDPGGPDPVKLTFSGINLNGVRQAQLVQGDTRISDPNVVGNPGQVVAHFALPRTPVPTGAWDVVVIDAVGRQARLPGAVTIRAPGAAIAAPPVVPPAASI